MLPLHHEARKALPDRPSARLVGSERWVDYREIVPEAIGICGGAEDRETAGVRSVEAKLVDHQHRAYRQLAVSARVHSRRTPFRRAPARGMLCAFDQRFARETLTGERFFLRKGQGCQTGAGPMLKEQP